MLRDASDHAVQAAPHRWYSRSGSRFRRHPSPFPYRLGLLLRAAPEHGSVRAALCGWYSRSRNGSRLRKHPSPFPCRWGLLLRGALNHVLARGLLEKWYSSRGSRFRRHPSRVSYRWGLAHHNAPEHDYLGFFCRISHHTPHRPLWWCRLLCHRYSLRYHLSRSASK